eukprot:CAMPEP_0116886128 /NCGR_PEP_ID=MMETSP0463-20121206/19811_1 /TAXON_ID=181622 /ORGANISM="Strombidinopsis sp, Strain SopsisLIS2011" /LENGTH=34 /DNA_ID= /DNA_START= /DNA_END= /DNA_ORIENTATION=
MGGAVKLADTDVDSITIDDINEACVAWNEASADA